jgi:hypothetical protein
MIAWCNKYIDWLQTAPTANAAATATKCVLIADKAELPFTFSVDSNHGTIFVNQLAGLKLIVKDVAGAANLTEHYFSGLYQGQLAANGDQAWIFSLILLSLPQRPLAS